MQRFDKFSTSNLDTKQNPSLQEVWPLFFQRTQPMAPRVLRDTPNLKFRLNDGNLRIGRGFGKRSENIEIKRYQESKNVCMYRLLE